jgi:CDGSH iron-sulfur domain-containing protein 3
VALSTHSLQTALKADFMTEPVVAQKAPYPVAVEAGKTYWWCACGRSKTQPFCDGSHKGTGLNPVQFKAEAAKTFYFCGCKATKKPPLCDGTHLKLLPSV